MTGCARPPGMNRGGSGQSGGSGGGGSRGRVDMGLNRVAKR